MVATAVLLNADIALGTLEQRGRDAQRQNKSLQQRNTISQPGEGKHGDDECESVLQKRSECAVGKCARLTSLVCALM